MNPFEQVEIRKTGAKVTRLGLGGAPLSGMKLAGGLYGGSAYNEALRIIRRAYDLGVRYFDTAPLYGDGRSEVRYGNALSGFPRNSFVISTKVGRVLNPTGNGASVPPDGLPNLKAVFDLSRDGILRSLEESLKRLRMDRVEILLLHDPDVENLEEAANRTAFPTMLELREKGVVKAIGTGMNQWEMPLRFIRRFDLDVVLLAGRYTLLDHTGLPEFLPECEKRGVKVIVGGPYNSGILARDLNGPVSFNYQPAPVDLVARARALKAVCDRHKVDLKAAALQFVLAHPAIATAIPGAQSVSELEENVSMASAKIPADLWRELKATRLIPANAPTA
ncbi:MAG: aldo/keto reductase [Chloroflexi bacterium]|nr:aldo/keto reductase [Chloroflexota bacterium]